MTVIGGRTPRDSSGHLGTPRDPSGPIGTPHDLSRPLTHLAESPPTPSGSDPTGTKPWPPNPSRMYNRQTAPGSRTHQHVKVTKTSTLSFRPFNRSLYPNIKTPTPTPTQRVDISQSIENKYCVYVNSIISHTYY